ncbi:hypothetical protein, partial [Streptomyces sp. NPDC059949]|uniref:hypothetical protein n=1 Tax=Streptomyces sp. NPDC059949 TaxID=3347013 RepID=UPI003646946B
VTRLNEAADQATSEVVRATTRWRPRCRPGPAAPALRWIVLDVQPDHPRPCSLRHSRPPT